MNAILIILFLVITPFAAIGQKVNKLIRQKDVTRIMTTLAADDMMGRSAMVPEKINTAAAFIENEFSKIKLTPLKGLAGFHQEFTKSQIYPVDVSVTLNGTSLNSEDVILVSEKSQLDLDRGLGIRTIDYDSASESRDSDFSRKAFGYARDTSSILVLVAPEFKESFQRLKSRLSKRFTSDRRATKVFVLGKGPVSSYSIKAKQQIEKVSMANVVGMLEGKSKPGEVVIFSGHYDHIGIQGANEAGDSIANGADDDASGTTAVIELARYFKKLNNNERTLIFVAFTAEEVGGFGARYFSEQLDPAKVVAMFNIEMIGKPSKWGKNYAFITGYEKSDFGQILQRNLAGSPFQFQPDPYPKQNLFYRSDNATLARLGVPAHSISTDQIDIDKFYHTVDDEVETLDMNNLTVTIRAIALASRSIVAGSDTPTRVAQSDMR
jgi:hypothetical protein